VTVLVDFGFLTGADIPTQYLRLGHATYGKIGTGQLAPDELMVDYSGRLMSMQVQRTSSRTVGPLVQYNAGTCSLTLLNSDGALDPVNLAYPAPGVAVRVRKVWNSVTYPIFRGFVTAWEPEHRSPTVAVINVQAVDGFDSLAGYDRTALGVPVGAGEKTGARLNRILDSVGWPTSDRDIATGDSTLQATDMAGDALAEAQAAVTAEVGEFYVNASGNMYFRNRNGLLLDSRSTVSQATFGSNRAGGEIAYVGTPGVSYDRDQLVNLVSATIVGGTEQVADDPASRLRYRDHPHSESSLMLTTDADALSWARYVLRTDTAPEFRFTSITVDARVQPSLAYPQILGREFGDRITVVRRPPGGIVDSRDVYVRSIEHAWQAPSEPGVDPAAHKWITTWGLQPADKFSFLILGHAQQGRIGSNSLGF